eukprot:UN24556
MKDNKVTEGGSNTETCSVHTLSTVGVIRIGNLVSPKHHIWFFHRKQFIFIRMFHREAHNQNEL